MFDIAIKVSIHIFSNTDNFVEKIKIIRGYKTTNEKRMPFGKYIETMLKSLGITVPDKEKGNVMWKDYKTSKADNGFSVVNVADGREESLFYDLLIEYIKQRKHTKKND